MSDPNYVTTQIVSMDCGCQSSNTTFPYDCGMPLLPLILFRQLPDPMSVKPMGSGYSEPTISR